MTSAERAILQKHLSRLLDEGCPHCGSKEAFTVEETSEWLVESLSNLPLDEEPNDSWVDVTCEKCRNFV